MEPIRTPADLLAWQPTPGQKMAATAAKGINIAGAVVYDAGMVNQARYAFGGAADQAHAASSQQALQQVSTAGNATAAIASALTAATTRLQTQQAAVIAACAQAKAQQFVPFPGGMKTVQGPFFMLNPAQIAANPEDSGLIPVCEGINNQIRLAVVQATTTDWAGYAKIGGEVLQLAMAFAPNRASSSPTNPATPNGTTPNVSTPNVSTPNGTTPTTGLAGASVQQLAGAPAMAGAGAPAPLASTPTASAGGSGGTMPFGGAPMAQREEGGQRRASTVDWRLAEDDSDVFAGRDTPTDDGVLA
jgi:hypothetical protein